MSEQPPLAAEIDYVRWGAELQAALSQSLAGVYLRGARAVQVGTAAGATARVTTAAGRLVGWSLKNDHASDDATVNLYDGTDNTGALVATVALDAGASETKHLGAGVGVVYGLYVEITGTGAGSVRGAVYLGATE